MTDLLQAERELHLLEAEKARKAEARAKALKEYDEIDNKAHRAKALVEQLKGAKHD